MCTDSLLFAWTLAHQQSGAAVSAVPHNHPSRAKVTVARFNTHVAQVGKEAIKAEKQATHASGGQKHLLVRVMLPPSIFDWLLNPFFGFFVLLTRILSC
jgi:hypothetical protein